MTPARRTGLWVGFAFCASLVAAIAAMTWAGAGENGTVVALRVTARISYGFFWPAYVGGAGSILFGPAFGIVGRRVRQFGLAFASAQLVHVALVAWLAWVSPAQSVTDAVMPFFAIAVIWTYLLAAISTDRVRHMLSADMVKRLRAIGSEYIALTFFVDFVLVPKYPPNHLILYAPFWCMLVAGPILRLAAAIKGLLRPRAVFRA